MSHPAQPPAPPPWADGPYSIKRHGVSIANCDSEPVQTPGCIQGHGVLLVLRLTDLTILQASENSRVHLGHSPEELLGQPSAKVVGEAGAAQLRDFLAQEPVERNPLYVFSLPGRPGAGPLDVTVHTADGVVLLECEAMGRTQAPVERDYYELMKKAVARLQSAQSLAGFCQAVTAEVRAVTGLDRVMVYRFHEDFHGEVVAESRREDLPAWLGLHYPAEDIPKPAREIFKRIWIRPLPQVGAPVMELVPLANPGHGQIRSR